MKIILKKGKKNLIMLVSLVLLFSIVMMILLVPQKVKCTLTTSITNEIVNATFRANNLKFIEVITRVSYENKKETEVGMKLQEIGIKAIKNYGYKVTSKIENNTIVIEYSGKVKNIKNNIYTKNIKIDDFKKNMQEKHYNCK